ncbi:MAG: rhodanese-like domain-containing protein [Prevotella sp.]|nr:rhodanese-like domain-containing protein [Prevotella sp.]MDD4533153.1 rhodanese-like domain-containing protein [Prevotella sp.]
MRKFILAVTAVLGLSLNSCSKNVNVTTVNAQEFNKAITADSVQLVDVRTAEEYHAGRIAYAKNNDVTMTGFKQRAIDSLDKTKPVYVYCHSGRRSLSAAGILSDAGFKVVNLHGGYNEWRFANLPTNVPR